jgi:hypothetical protein
MWFDPWAALGELEAEIHANGSNPARRPAGQFAGFAGLATLPDDLALVLELREERAAIREYDGGQDRDAAEAAALTEVAQAARMDPTDLARLWKSGR